MKVKQFIQHLRRKGVRIIERRGKSGHVLARYKNRQATIPVHSNTDLGPIFIKKICKQLGVELENE